MINLSLRESQVALCASMFLAGLFGSYEFSNTGPDWILMFMPARLALGKEVVVSIFSIIVYAAFWFSIIFACVRGWNYLKNRPSLKMKLAYLGEILIALGVFMGIGWLTSLYTPEFFRNAEKVGYSFLAMSAVLSVLFSYSLNRDMKALTEGEDLFFSRLTAEDGLRILLGGFPAYHVSKLLRKEVKKRREK